MSLKITPLLLGIALTGLTTGANAEADAVFGGPNGVPGELEQTEAIVEAFRVDNRKIALSGWYDWKRELQDGNLRAFPGHGNPRDEELYRLRKELAEITEERDILRKAVAIFSKPKK